MAKKIEQWQADDGTVFDTFQEARAHDRERELADVIGNAVEAFFYEVDGETIIADVDLEELPDLAAKFVRDKYILSKRKPKKVKEEAEVVEDSPDTPDTEEASATAEV
jgi:hypothetical protein